MAYPSELHVRADGHYATLATWPHSALEQDAVFLHVKNVVSLSTVHGLVQGAHSCAFSSSFRARSKRMRSPAPIRFQDRLVLENCVVVKHRFP